MQISAPNRPENMTEQPSFLRNILIPIGSALVLALSFLAQGIPFWAATVIVTYLGVVVLWIILPGLFKGLSVLRERSIKRKMAETYFPYLINIIESFEPQLESTRTETVFYVWKSAASWEGSQAIVRPDHAHLDTLAGWLHHLLDAARHVETKQLDLVAKQLASWVSSYARFMEDACRELESLLAARKLDENKTRELKQGWNHVRDAHNRMLSDWLNLCKEINAVYGHEVCRTYYPMLKPLE
jgi:hypothetical protein